MCGLAPWCCQSQRIQKWAPRELIWARENSPGNLLASGSLVCFLCAEVSESNFITSSRVYIYGGKAIVFIELNYTMYLGRKKLFEGFQLLLIFEPSKGRAKCNYYPQCCLKLHLGFSGPTLWLVSRTKQTTQKPGHLFPRT